MVCSPEISDTREEGTRDFVELAPIVNKSGRKEKTYNSNNSREKHLENIVRMKRKKQVQDCWGRRRLLCMSLEIYIFSSADMVRLGSAIGWIVKGYRR